jgi:hypothetical protein
MRRKHIWGSNTTINQRLNPRQCIPVTHTGGYGVLTPQTRTTVQGLEHLGLNPAPWVSYGLKTRIYGSLDSFPVWTSTRKIAKRRCVIRKGGIIPTKQGESMIGCLMNSLIHRKAYTLPYVIIPISIWVKDVNLTEVLSLLMVSVLLVHRILWIP